MQTEATVAPSGQVGWWAGDGDANDIAVERIFFQDFNTNTNGITFQGGSWSLSGGQLQSSTTSGLTASATVSIPSVFNPKFSALITAQTLTQEGPQISFQDSASDFYSVDYFHQAGQLRILKNATVLSNVPSSLPLNTQLPMSFEINGNSITGRLGSAVVSANLPLVQPVTGVSFGGYFNGEFGLWDNLEITGNGDNGTLENGAGFAVGKVGQSFNFPNQQASVSIPNNPALFLSSALSIEAWVNPSTYSGCSSHYRVFHTVRAVLRGYVTFI